VSDDPPAGQSFSNPADRHGDGADNRETVMTPLIPPAGPVATDTNVVLAN